MSEQKAMPPLPAGWYPRPETPSLMSYWDGERWSEAVPAPVAAPARQGTYVALPKQSEKLSDWMLVAGLIGMVLMPIAGFVIGIIAANRGRSGLGTVMIVVSIVSGLWWYSMLSGPTYTYY